MDFHKPTGSKNTHPEMFHCLYKHFSNRAKFISPVYIQHDGNYIIGFYKYFNVRIYNNVKIIN